MLECIIYHLHNLYTLRKSHFAKKAALCLMGFVWQNYHTFHFET